MSNFADAFLKKQHKTNKKNNAETNSPQHGPAKAKSTTAE
jgi:hypothetical protein